MKLQEGIAKVQEFIVSICLLAITAVVFLQVFGRKVIPFPMPWTEEIAKVSLLFLTYFGLAATFTRGYHIRVDLLDFILKKGKRAQITEIFMQVLMMLFSTIVFYYGYVYFNNQLDFQQRTVVLGIPLYIVILPIIISGVLCFIQAIINIAIMVKGSDAE